MSKIAVIFWSQSGNTEAMANEIFAGAKEAGGAVELFTVSEISPDQAANYDVIAMGCPAMGAEVLEESEFEPFFTELEGKLSGKKVALFGSYGWGDGQWMRDWEERTTAAGAQLYGNQGLIINEAPDTDGLSACRRLGGGLAAF